MVLTYVAPRIIDVKIIVTLEQDDVEKYTKE